MDIKEELIAGGFSIQDLFKEDIKIVRKPYGYLVGALTMKGMNRLSFEMFDIAEELGGEVDKTWDWDGMIYMAEVRRR